VLRLDVVDAVRDPDESAGRSGSSAASTWADRRPMGMNCSATLVQWVTEFSAGSAVLAGVPSPSTASTTIAATVRMALIMVPPSKEPLC
jgi:hypothetical protein